MKKIVAAALTAGILTASCSGGQMGQSMMPAWNGTSAATNARPSLAAQLKEVVPAGWAPTATHGIKPARGTDTGRLVGSKLAMMATKAGMMTVRVGLKVRNQTELVRAIEARQIVSPSEFRQRFAPSQADVQAVRDYLLSQGLRNVKVTPDNLLVSADGQPAQIERAFNTQFETFGTPKGPAYANVKPALVPQRLGSIVTAVLGLNNVAKFEVHPKASPCFPVNPAPSGTPCLRDYGPQEMQTFYDAGTTPTGSRTTIAVMAEGDVSSTVSDLKFAESQTGLPVVPVTVVTVGLASSDTSGSDEWNLDTQASTGIAQTVKHLYLYATTSLTDSDIANEYDRWVTDDKAQLGNSSFGECEYSPYLDGSMAIDDEVLMEGAAHGQTMFASTGDNGSACAVVPANGAPASGLPMVNYPASSPWVVGVGGTTLASNNDDTYEGELSWNSGGGGLSQFENSTTYMQKVQLVGGTVAEANLRGLPDVAMAADPNAGGYNVYFQTPLETTTGACPNPCGIGGTSESSPLAMGTYARLQSAHNNTLGFGGPQLYNVYIENPSATATLTGPPPTQVIGGYHDIITGTNGAYQALPSYDYTTGMGTFDISLMNEFIGH